MILTPDISATEDIDILALKLRFELEVAQSVHSEHGDIAASLVAEAQAAIDSYTGSGPRLTIGYLPAAKITELEHRHRVLVRGKDIKNLDAATMNELADICREWARWGVRKHTLSPRIDTEEVEYRGRKYKLAGADAIDIYERNGWLHLIRNEVQRYNTLSQEKKTVSSSNAGIDQPTSTVDSASKSPQ